MPVFVVSGAAAWIAARTTSAAGERAAINRAIGVACAASWIPPIVIFFAQRSPGCALLALGLAVALCRAILLRSAPPEESRPGIFPAVFIAGCLQAGLIAAAISNWRVAAIALALASSVLTWMLTAAAVWPHPALRAKRPRRIRLAPAFLLAVTFSAGGLSSYLARGGGSGADWAPGQSADEAKSNGQGGAAHTVVIGESYPGVILWPDVDEKSVTLVAPLPSAGRSLFPNKEVDELSIPFYGAYWYFRGPGQPPKNSFVTHGDPAKLSFRSTDLRPLAMEARQNLGKLIETSCCSSVLVSIRNRDRWPGTLGLELILRNTEAPDKASRSLGVEAIRSGRPSDNLPAVDENVPFRMPPASAFPRFDEVSVRFHLLPPRSDRSARVAIRRFIFVR